MRRQVKFGEAEEPGREGLGLEPAAAVCGCCQERAGQPSADRAGNLPRPIVVERLQRGDPAVAAQVAERAQAEPLQQWLVEALRLHVNVHPAEPGGVVAVVVIRGCNPVNQRLHLPRIQFVTPIGEAAHCVVDPLKVIGSTGPLDRLRDGGQ